MTGPIWGVVVAAGSGVRFGGYKQFLDLGGRPVAGWALDAVRSVAGGVVLVVPSGFDREPWMLESAEAVVVGGATRAASVRAALEAVPPEAAIVVIHDAVRPLASAELFRAVVGAVEAGAEGAVPGLPVVDTVKHVADGVVRATVDRSGLVRVQTPQAFDALALRRAHEAATEATDDAALVEALGGRVVVVQGEEWNLKVTSSDDLAVLEWRLAVRSRGGR